MYNYTQKQGNIKRELDILLSKTLSMFRYEGLPDTIPQRELERQLQMKGYAFVTKVEGKLYSFTDGLGGLPDPYGNPTKITIANPALKYNATLDLEKDGVLIRSDSMMNGLKYLLEKYATMMTESEVTMMVNSYNARFPALISAGDDKTRESAEQYLQRIINGEMGIIAENQLFEGVKVQNNGGGGSVFTQLIEYQQYLKATLYNELGLEMNNNMKRERLTQDEVNMTDIIYPFIDNMLTNRQMAVEKINKMFNKEITVGLDSVWAKHAPSDAWDDDQFYEELDEYLDLLLGQQEELQPTEAPVEEDILPGVSEEELIDILEQLKLLSEENEDGDRESGADNGDSADSVAVASEELTDAPESGGDTEPGDGSKGYDRESDGPDSTESDGPSGEHNETASGESTEAGTDDASDDATSGDGDSSTTTDEHVGDDDSSNTSGDGSTAESGSDDGRRSLGVSQTDETHIELTVSNRRSGDEDSGARSEEEIHDESAIRSESETDVSSDAIGSGSTSVDITDDNGGDGQELLEGAEPHVETEVYAVELQFVEDELQTVEVGIEIQETESEEQPSVEEEESEDES